VCRFRLPAGPKAGSCVLPAYDGDAIFEWEELVPVTKSAILTDLGTPTEDDEPEDDAESEDEAEDEEEDECDGSCLACTIIGAPW